MYFHTDEPSMAGYIADVARTAEETGTRLRISVDSYGNLRLKRGEGIWSPPFASTPDPYRDKPKPKGMKWFINEDGHVYDYPAEYQAMVFPNDYHTPYDSEEEAEAAACNLAVQF